MELPSNAGRAKPTTPSRINGSTECFFSLNYGKHATKTSDVKEQWSFVITEIFSFVTTAVDLYLADNTLDNLKFNRLPILI